MLKTIIFICFILCISIFSCKDPVESKPGFQKSEEHKQKIDGGEQFEVVDFSSVNMKLIKRQDDPSPEAIMKIFYPHAVEGGEGNEQIIMTRHELSENEIEVKLIHENLSDDSINSEKYIMRTKRVGKRWMVVSLKRNWKCETGRGHENWSTENCG